MRYVGSLPLQRAYSLLEIMVAVAIIAILALVGLGSYQKYVSRAQSAEIAVKYDAIRTNLRVDVADGVAADCAVAASKFDTKNLPEKYATLGYSFEAVPGGFRPVLSVCATAGKHTIEGVNATRAAHDLLADKGVVEKGAVLTDSVVSFALRLTAGDNAVCKAYTKPTTGDCTGAAPQQVVVPQVGSPQQAIAPQIGSPQQAIAPLVCNSTHEKLTITLRGNPTEICVTRCPAGTTRSSDPAHPLDCVDAAGARPQPQSIAPLVCSSTHEKVTIPLRGTPTDICVTKCPAGTTRSSDPAHPLDCVGASVLLPGGSCPVGTEVFELRQPGGSTKSMCLPKCPAGQIRISDPSAGLICAAPTSSQSAGALTCPADQDKVMMPQAFGGTKETCVAKCPAGQTRSLSPSNPAGCVGVANLAPVVCGPDQDKITTMQLSGQVSETCIPKCPAGQTRSKDPLNPRACVISIRLGG